MSKQRHIALEILSKIYREGVYSNLYMRDKLKEVEEIQRPFITELVNGVVRHDLFLRYQFKDLIKKDTKKELIMVLMLAYYEYLFLDKDIYTVTNEYVKLVKKVHKPFINAVLRNNLDRKPEIKGSEEEILSIKSSLPLWIIELLKQQYDKEQLEYYLNDYISVKPEVYYHQNTNKKLDDEKFLNSLEWKDDHCFTAKENLLNHPYFKKGYFYVQDMNNQKIAEYLDVHDGQLILDACSAPGSKFFNILEKVKDKSKIYANDINSNRLDLIKKMARNLGYDELNYFNLDAGKLEKTGMMFDRILLDVPCSGLGVLKRRSDLKLNLKKEDLEDIEKTQKQILISAYNVLKPGGLMVYSTCTLNKRENEYQVAAFLNEHPDCELSEQRLLTGHDGCDSFFLSQIRKKA